MRPEWNEDNGEDIQNEYRTIRRKEDERIGYKILTQAEPKPTTMTFGDS